MTDDTIIEFPERDMHPAEEANPNEPNDRPLTPAANMLFEAAMLIDGDRNDQHGDRHKNFANIAMAWTAYLGVAIRPDQVALMMGIMKGARTKSGSYNPDDYTDAAAYFALAGELAEPEE